LARTLCAEHLQNTKQWLESDDGKQDGKGDENVFSYNRDATPADTQLYQTESSESYRQQRVIAWSQKREVSYESSYQQTVVTSGSKVCVAPSAASVEAARQTLMRLLPATPKTSYPGGLNSSNCYNGNSLKTDRSHYQGPRDVETPQDASQVRPFLGEKSPSVEAKRPEDSEIVVDEPVRKIVIRRDTDSSRSPTTPHQIEIKPVRNFHQTDHSEPTVLLPIARQVLTRSAVSKHIDSLDLAVKSPVNSKGSSSAGRFVGQIKTTPARPYVHTSDESDASDEESSVASSNASLSRSESRIPYVEATVYNTTEMITVSVIDSLPSTRSTKPGIRAASLDADARIGVVALMDDEKENIPDDTLSQANKSKIEIDTNSYGSDRNFDVKPSSTDYENTELSSMRAIEKCIPKADDEISIVGQLAESDAKVLNNWVDANRIQIEIVVKSATEKREKNSAVKVIPDASTQVTETKTNNISRKEAQSSERINTSHIDPELAVQSSNSLSSLHIDNFDYGISSRASNAGVLLGTDVSKVQTVVHSGEPNVLLKSDKPIAESRSVLHDRKHDVTLFTADEAQKNGITRTLEDVEGRRDIFLDAPDEFSRSHTDHRRIPVLVGPDIGDLQLDRVKDDKLSSKKSILFPAPDYSSSDSVSAGEDDQTSVLRNSRRGRGSEEGGSRNPLYSKSDDENVKFDESITDIRQTSTDSVETMRERDSTPEPDYDLGSSFDEKNSGFYNIGSASVKGKNDLRPQTDGNTDLTDAIDVRALLSAGTGHSGTPTTHRTLSPEYDDGEPDEAHLFRRNSMRRVTKTRRVQKIKVSQASVIFFNIRFAMFVCIHIFT